MDLLPLLPLPPLLPVSPLGQCGSGPTPSPAGGTGGEGGATKLSTSAHYQNVLGSLEIEDLHNLCLINAAAANHTNVCLPENSVAVPPPPPIHAGGREGV